jgi:hypothetical protein
MVVHAYNCTYFLYSLLWSPSRISWIIRLTRFSLRCAFILDGCPCLQLYLFFLFLITGPEPDQLTQTAHSLYPERCIDKMVVHAYNCIHFLYSLFWCPIRISWIRRLNRFSLRCSYRLDGSPCLKMYVFYCIPYCGPRAGSADSDGSLAVA